MQVKKLVGGGVALLAVVVGATLGMKSRADARAADTEARATRLLDDRYRDVYGPRELAGWVRPVLRSPELDENAAVAQRAAVEKIAKLPDDVSTSISLAVKDGTPLSPAAQAFVVAQLGGLEELRRATHGRYAFTHTDPHERMPTGNIPAPALAAAKILLASATLEPAEECVRIGADTIRLGQDLSPGGYLTPALIGGAIIRLTVPLIVRCGDRLGAAQRKEAVRELRLLAENPPPFGEVLDTEWLFMGYGVMHAARESGADGMRVRWETWKAVEEIVAAPPSFGKITSTSYPGTFGLVATYDHQFDGSNNPILQIAKPSLLRYTHEDAKTQAWVRALVIALTAQGEGHALGAQTHAALDSPSLCDPFNGHPLTTQTVADGSIVISAQSPAPESGGPDKDLVRVVITPAKNPLDLPQLR
jgi:hypothetical protein